MDQALIVRGEGKKPMPVHTVSNWHCRCSSSSSSSSSESSSFSADCACRHISDDPTAIMPSSLTVMASWTIVSGATSCSSESVSFSISYSSNIDSDTEVWTGSGVSSCGNTITVTEYIITSPFCAPQWVFSYNDNVNAITVVGTSYSVPSYCSSYFFNGDTTFTIGSDVYTGTFSITG